MLLSSLPEVGVRYAEKRLSGIPGRPPSLLDPPTGCRFRDRCPLAFEKCGEEPPFASIAPGPHGRLLEGGSLMLRSTPAARRTASARSAAASSLPSATSASRSRPGEVVSLIGESGSGKSTIGKMILRLLRVTRGTIRFDGADISTLERRRLKAYYGDVQGVFQDPFSSYNPIFKADRVFTMSAQRVLLRRSATRSGARSSRSRSRP